MRVKKILSIILIILFLWIMFITNNPIQPQKLSTKYPLCNMHDISSWETSPYTEEAAIKIPIDNGLYTNYIKLIVNDPQNNITAVCKTNIPETVLYKARTINFSYKVNQSSNLTFTIFKKGMGPRFKTETILPENTNKKVTSTWLIEESVDPKTNWLSGPYDSAVISFEPFDHLKPLILSVYEIYLQ